MFRAFRLLAKKPTPAPAKAKSAAPARLALEPLEDRAVPATFTVTSLEDRADRENSPAAVGELRWAIQQANNTPGKDTINFRAGLTGTIQLRRLGLLITDPVDITGPGARSLTIRGHQTFPFDVPRNVLGIFNFDVPRDLGSSSISDVTIANARSTGVVVRANTVLTLNRVAVKNNEAHPGGGSGGGAENRGELNVFDSTFSGNAAVGGGRGGAIYSDGALNVRNSTFADNHAGNFGAGGAISTFGSATIDNSTIYGNLSNDSTVHALGGTMTIRSTIIANTTGSGPGVVDLANTTSAQLLVQNSLIGKTTATFAPGSANNILGKDPRLQPLANNGGPTDTFLPEYFNSPVVGFGSNPNELTTDQRGRPRMQGDSVDIGAVEAIWGRFGRIVGKVTPASPPTAYAFTLPYAGVNATSLDAGDVSVVGPAGRLSAVLVSVVPDADGATLAATYAVVPPGGRWDHTDNGSYTIELNDGQVLDTEGNPVVAQVLGEFEVEFAPICDPTDDPNTCFVKKLYADLLGRDADAGGLAGYKALLDGGASRASVVESITNSDESARYQIASLYQSVLGRDADEAGLAGYQLRVRGGATYEDIAVELLSSAEFLRRYPNAADYATTLYALFLERLPDPQGLAAHAELFNTRGARAVARAIIESPEAGDDALRGLYRQTLLRDATAEELLRDGPRFRGQTKAKLQSSLLATDEYFTLRK